MKRSECWNCTWPRALRNGMYERCPNCEDRPRSADTESAKRGPKWLYRAVNIVMSILGGIGGAAVYILYRPYGSALGAAMIALAAFLMFTFSLLIILVSVWPERWIDDV